MKSLSKILIALLVLIFMGTGNYSFAQNIDNNRMNRDIKIMENVLGEMFETSLKTPDNKSVSYFSIGGSGDIRGTYLPGYGIIFSVPGTKNRVLQTKKDDEDGSYSYIFEYSDESGSDNEVNKESITLRIKEFLREYGSTIGQLQDNEKIMVIYNQTSRSSGITFLRSSSVRMETNKLPTISVVVTKKDLQAYRSGSISKSELDERFSVSTVETKNNNQLDLKVMANIFETAFKNSDENSFRITGSVNYLSLDNFGSIFSLEIVQGNNLRKILSGFKAVAENLKVAFDADSASVKSISWDKEKDKERNELEKEAAKNFDLFVNDLKTYIVDYGRTLRSVDSDQYILVSANINHTYGTLPDRVDLQLKKSVLEAMDKGSMSREQAINQISVREY